MIFFIGLSPSSQEQFAHLVGFEPMRRDLTAT
jgi:hypothetical protein